jgi:hypothetical protein
MEEWPPIWRVAVNILNKHSRRADKGWSSNLGLGEEVTILTIRTGLVMKWTHVPGGWTDPLA